MTTLPFHKEQGSTKMKITKKRLKLHNDSLRSIVLDFSIMLHFINNRRELSNEVFSIYNKLMFCLYKTKPKYIKKANIEEVGKIINSLKSIEVNFRKLSNHMYFEHWQVTLVSGDGPPEYAKTLEDIIDFYTEYKNQL